MQIGVLFVILLIIAAVVFVVYRGWCVRAAFGLVFFGALLLFIVGFQRLVDNLDTNDALGAVLTGMALVLGLVEAVVARRLYSGAGGSSVESSAVPSPLEGAPSEAG